MTCIVALQSEEGVWLGTDSGVTTSHIVSDCGPKVIQFGEIVIAYAGSVRAAQILEHNVTIPKLPKVVTARVLVRKLVDPLRTAVASHGGTKESSELELLVIVRGKIWVLTDNYTLLPCTRGYGVGGEAEDIARGVVEALEDQPPKVRVTRALEIAEKLCNSVKGPFHIRLC